MNVAAVVRAGSLAQRLHAACPDIFLREEAAHDDAFLRDLYAEVRAPELAPVPWSVDDKRRFTDSQFDLQRKHYRAAYAGAEFLVVERSGERAGRLYLSAFANEIRVMEISLAASRRGAGVGTRLLGALLAIAESEGKGVGLHVEPSNPAQRLYRRLGFRFVEYCGVYDFLLWP